MFPHAIVLMLNVQFNEVKVLFHRFNLYMFSRNVPMNSLAFPGDP